MSSVRRFLRLFYRISYWLIPAVVLYLVFRRIDLQGLVLILNRSNPWLVVLGIAYYPIVVMIGAWRWRALLTAYIGTVPRRFVLKHYWTGLAIGYFMPGSLGWDAYRVAVAGRRYGHYTMNVAVIVVEKLSALVCCTAIIVVLSPAVPVSGQAGLSDILRLAYVLVACLLAAGLTTLLLWRNQSWLNRLESGSAILLNKLFARFSAGGKVTPATIPLREMIEPLTSRKCLVPVLALSFAIQFLGGLANQVFFLALGYKISIVANLFLGPVLFFIFLLPISFGSLGVREATYIVLYGLWGVPAETALLVSFFNLIGLLLNNAAGGLVMLVSNARGEDVMAAEPRH
jgi:glycosyltransferase 2 family protein